ncbi:RNA-binding component of cleavage and polyadenylation factor [Leucoagaricus gongylophorus]
MALVAPLSLKDIISPQLHQISFPAETYIKSELNIKLDKDDQICRLFLTPAGCPLGPLHCPLRHTTPSAQNFQPPKPLPSHPRERERVSTVCKHWLRGLCKKGDACEFLHEYNLRRMPECYWFAKYGYCSAGDECLYAHPKERKIECPDYNRGFCKLGLWFSSHSNSVLHFGFSLRSYVPSQACSQSSLPALSHWLLPHGTRMPPRPPTSPKPNLPSSSAYEPPPPPSTRDLGPPPPGFARYADLDKAPGLAPGPSAQPQMPQRRDPNEVTCFKCGEKGHYANHCRNRNVPGNRGGTERVRRYGGDD